MLEVLNHTVNVHEWLFGKCDHGPLDEDDRGDKQWLDPAGHATVALEKVIRNPRFLGNIGHYTTCQ